MVRFQLGCVRYILPGAITAAVNHYLIIMTDAFNTNIRRVFDSEVKSQQLGLIFKLPCAIGGHLGALPLNVTKSPPPLTTPAAAAAVKYLQ